MALADEFEEHQKGLDSMNEEDQRAYDAETEEIAFPRTWQEELMDNPNQSCSGIVLKERLAALSEDDGGKRYDEFRRVEEAAFRRARS